MRQGRIVRPAMENSLRCHHRTEPLRFDIIAIVGSGANAEIRHTKKRLQCDEFLISCLKDTIKTGCLALYF